MDTQAEVQFLIDKKLRERGLTVVQESPDLLVSMLIAADVKEVEEMKTKHGDAVAAWIRLARGALLIELVDSQTGKTVWLGCRRRGTSAGATQSRSASSAWPTPWTSSSSGCRNKPSLGRLAQRQIGRFVQSGDQDRMLAQASLFRLLVQIAGGGLVAPRRCAEPSNAPR